MKEAASGKVFPKPGRILIAEVHTSDFDRVEKWIFEEVGIHDANDVGVGINVHSSQTMNTAHKLAVSARIVRAPPPALPRKEIFSSEFRTNILRRYPHRGSSKTETVMPATACWVLGIGESSEIKLRRIRESIIRQHGRKPNKAVRAGCYKER
jgi:hypothetical protein